MAAPPNVSRANAKLINSLPFEIIQPVAEGGTYYANLWYRISNTNLFNLGSAVWNLNGGNSYLYVERDDTQVLITAGDATQFSTHIGPATYFRVFTETNAAIPNASIKLQVYIAPSEDVQPWNIVVPCSNSSDTPLSVVSNTDHYKINNFINPTVGHSFGGIQGCGDILLDGVSCIEDNVGSGFSVYDRDYGRIITHTFGSAIHIKRNARGNRFWICYREDGSGVYKMRPIEPDGSLGPLIGVSYSTAFCANDNILYYKDGLTGKAVKRWDIVNNLAMTDFVPPLYNDVIEGEFLGEPREILALNSGDVIVLYTKCQNSPNSIFATRFNAVGQIVHNYGGWYTDEFARNQMAFGADEDSFWIWRHIKGESIFDCIKISDGSTLVAPKQAEFFRGVYKGTIYNGTTPRIDFPRFGVEFSDGGVGASFWVQSVLSLAGAHNPGMPPGPAIGGGLIVVEKNTSRHDTYFDGTGQPVAVPIQARIRTAFIGE